MKGHGVGRCDETQNLPGGTRARVDTLSPAQAFGGWEGKTGGWGGGLDPGTSVIMDGSG